MNPLLFKNLRFVTRPRTPPVSQPAPCATPFVPKEGDCPGTLREVKDLAEVERLAQEAAARTTQAARNSIHTAVKCDWYLLEEERELLDKWYVLKWSQQYFQGKCSHCIDPIHKFIGEVIHHDFVAYHVHYKKGYKTPVKYPDQVVISFRRIAGQQIGIALVRTANRVRGEKGG